MGRTFSAVSYTYLNRGMYYFVIAASITVDLAGCQTIMPKSNGMADNETSTQLMFRLGRAILTKPESSGFAYSIN